MRFDIAVAIGAITTSFAINSIITRYVVLGNYGSPFALTVVRFVSGLVVLLALNVFMPKTFPNSKTNEKSSSYFFGAAFLGAYAFAISYGYLYISAAAGTFTFYASTLITMSLLSYLEDRDKVILHRVFGQFLAFLGVTMITFSGIRAVTPIGISLLVITGVSWGLYSQYGRRFSNPFGYTYNSFLIFGIASLVLSLLVYLFFFSSSSVSPLWIQFSLNGLGLALYMGMISTALSYVLWSRILKRIKGYQGGVVQLIVPVLAGLMGVFLLHEQITPLLVIGGATILAGIYLNAV